MPSTTAALFALRGKTQIRYQFAKERFRALVDEGHMELALRYFEAAVRLERLLDFLDHELEREE